LGSVNANSEFPAATTRYCHVVEYEYPGAGTPSKKTKRCLDYARSALLNGGRA
jgi:hypothetical protein